MQAGVAGALRNLSVTEANRKMIVVSGGMEALVLASQVPTLTLTLTLTLTIASQVCADSVDLCASTSLG